MTFKNKLRKKIIWTYRIWRARHSLWTYYLAIIFLIPTILFGFTFFATATFREFFLDHVTSDLELRADILGRGLQDQNAFSTLGVRCEPLSTYGPYRVTVFRADGTAVCDSTAGDFREMDSHLSARAEVEAALKGETKTLTRLSTSFNETYLFVASPLTMDGHIFGVIRAGMAVSAIDRRLRDFSWKLIFVGTVITLLVSLERFFFFYRRIIVPLNEMRHGAERIARGRFEPKLPNYRTREVAALAFAMNRMADQLQHSEETRRDFVANVSHELKTPITSIKGFIETLLDGAMENPEDRGRFLEILSKQTDRMTTIIDDLLTMARLESDRANNFIVLQEEAAAELLQHSAELCRASALEKNIEIVRECEPDLTIYADRSLIQQVLINLLENAIKYSFPNSVIQLRAEAKDHVVVISVSDDGPGIPSEHLPRLFERFYRVDKARTRDVGGTGLGLAIVKHIVSAHRGTVQVTSQEGTGSVFSIRLPRVGDS